MAETAYVDDHAELFADIERLRIGNEKYHHGSSGASENVWLEPPY